MAKTKTATGPTKRPLDADYLRALVAAGYTIAPGSSSVPRGPWRPTVLDPGERYADADAAVEAFGRDPFAWPLVDLGASDLLVIHGEAEPLDQWLAGLGAAGAPRYRWTERSLDLGRGRLHWSAAGGTTTLAADSVARVAVVFHATVARRCLCCSSTHEHRVQCAPAGRAALVVANALSQPRPVAWVEGAAEAPVWPSTHPAGTRRDWPRTYPRPGVVVDAGPRPRGALLALPWSREAWSTPGVEPADIPEALLVALERPIGDTGEAMYARPTPLVGARVGYDPANEVPPRPSTPTEPPHGLDQVLAELGDYSPATAALGAWVGRRLAGGALDQVAADQVTTTMAQLAAADGSPELAAVGKRVGEALEAYLKRRAVYAEELATLPGRLAEWDVTHGWSEALLSEGGRRTDGRS